MKSTILVSAVETLTNESEALRNQIDFLDFNFEQAVQIISNTAGNLVVTGMGKSGHIGKKIAATMSSTGTPSIFLHPGEAYHGDLGMVKAGDPVLALSYSGETDEILRLIPFFKENNNPVIAITGKKQSTLALHADVHIYAHIDKEACPLSLAPTTSTTVTLALGDALAIALMHLKKFKEENFARFHPGGSLGRKLLAKVKSVMSSSNLPIAQPDSLFTEVITIISQGRLGLALINEHEKTIGVITDGDLRRIMQQKGKDAFELTAKEMMTNKPKTIDQNTSLVEAEEVFYLNKISSLVVTSESGDTVGVIQVYQI